MPSLPQRIGERHDRGAVVAEQIDQAAGFRSYFFCGKTVTFEIALRYLKFQLVDLHAAFIHPLRLLAM